MSLDVFLCICIVYVRNVFLRDLLFFCLHPFRVMGWFSYVFALYTFVTFFCELLFFFSHKQTSLVYIRYMSGDGFPMFLHCIRSLRFF